MSHSALSFIDLVLAGTVDVGAIDDFIDHWHLEPSDQSLHAFLGMTQAEYALWVAQPDQLETIVTAHRGRAVTRNAVAHEP